MVYLEQILENLTISINATISEVQELKNLVMTFAEKNPGEFISLKQLADTGKWPYTEMATRKMIERGKLKEGYHYKKIDGRYIFSFSALQKYLENNFYSNKKQNIKKIGA